MTELPEHLLFLDLETEGLDVSKHRVLEGAAYLVNVERQLIVDHVHLLLPPPELSLRDIRNWEPVVRDMHTASGLIADLANPDAAGIDSGTLTAFERRVVNMLGEHVPGQKVPLAGYGVGHMERDGGWLAVHFPLIPPWLTYWPIDVSTLRRSLGYFGFELPPKGDRHRADKDCLSAIAEWFHYGHRLTMQLSLDWLDNGGEPCTMAELP